MSYKKYASTATFITLFINSCHYHKKKDGVPIKISWKKNSNVFIIKLFVFTQLQGCCFVGRKVFSTFSVVFFFSKSQNEIICFLLSQKKHCYSSRWSKKNSQLVRLWGFFVDILCISYWRMKYKNVETSKQNKKYFYRLRVTIIAHPEIVFEKWVSPKMVQETGKKWVTKNTLPQQLLLRYLSTAAITTKKKMAFQ